MAWVNVAPCSARSSEPSSCPTASSSAGVGRLSSESATFRGQDEENLRLPAVADRLHQSHNAMIGSRGSSVPARYLSPGLGRARCRCPYRQPRRQTANRRIASSNGVQEPAPRCTGRGADPRRPSAKGPGVGAPDNRKVPSYPRNLPMTPAVDFGVDRSKAGWA